MFIKIFRDANPPEVPTGGGEPQVTTDIVALMAKGGSKVSEGGINTYTPAPQPPQRQEPQTPQEPQAATEPAAPTTEPAAITTPAQPATTPAQFTMSTEQAAQPQAPPDVVAPNWQDVLKTQPKDDVLSALGVDASRLSMAEKLDDKMLKFLQTWQNGGDVKAYLQAMTTDYQNMSPEQIMRLDLQRQFPEMSESEVNRLYKRKVEDFYKLNAELYDADEVEDGKLLLKADAQKIRQSFMKEQSDLLLSAPPAIEQVDTLAAKQAENAQILADYNKSLEADPFVKSFRETKAIKIGEGQESFNLTIDNPENVIALLNNADVFAKALLNADGTANFATQLNLATFLSNPKAYNAMLIAYGKTLGQASISNDIENASIQNPNQPQQAAASQDPIAQMAKGGRLAY